MIPKKPPTEADFAYLHFDSDKHPFGPLRRGSFADYCSRLDKYAALTLPKTSAPLWVHCVTAGPQSPARYNRRKTNLLGMTALVFDCDAAGAQRPTAFLASLHGIDYAYQERSGPGGEGLRYHLTLPLADYPERLPGEDGDQLAGRLRKRLQATRAWLDAQTGNAHDRSFDKPTQGIKPYTKRPGDDAAGVVLYCEYGYGERLDWEALLASWAFRDDAPRGPRREAGETDHVALKAYAHLLKAEAPRDKGGWFISCPIGHGDDSTSKTWLTPAGRVVCMAERCRDLSQGDFERALTGTAADAMRSGRTGEARKRLPPAAKRVRLESAGDEIRAALGRVDVTADVATVLRVTTGAGKTYWISRFLDAYTQEISEEAV